MDTLNIITAIYKNELSKVNDEKIAALAQCKIYKREINELNKQIQELKNNTIK